LIALIVGVSSLFIHVKGVEVQAADVEAKSRIEAPALARANEVPVTEASTAYVSSAREFADAYKAAHISRIKLENNIDIRSLQGEVRGHSLKRSLQIDGTNPNGADFTLRSGGGGVFVPASLSMGETYTFHLKHVNVWDLDANYFDNNTTEGWQLILDDTLFETQFEGNRKIQPYRVARLAKGHIFLRNNVRMQTTAENFYVGQITVEPNANVYGEINVINYSTWWFSEANEGVTSVDKSVNIGENAYVELIGTNGTTYPSIYLHWKEINVHKGATLKAAKPGNAFRFNDTTGVPIKRINVFEGATIEGTSTGSGAYPILEQAGNNEAHVYAAPGSIVKLIGRSDNAGNPVVKLASKGSSFELDQPAVYDIQNKLPAANAKAIQVGAEAKFKITSTDIEVWDGTNWDANKMKADDENVRDFSKTGADAGWYRASVVANSAGKAEAGTYDPYNTDKDLMTEWDTTKYSRITGVNGYPELAFEELTDADKSYVVDATVLDKPAWWEKQVTVQVRNDKDATTQEGKNDRYGKYIYIFDSFLEAGTTYTATGYRGVPEWPVLEDVSATVRDATPPKPVKVTQKLYHTDNHVSGTDAEPGASMSVTLNGKEIDLMAEPDNLNKLVIGEDGKWSFTLPDDILLQPGDVIQVFLTDTVGNKTPEQDTKYRDAIFEAATTITVVKDDVAPVLTVKTPIIYDKGQVVNHDQFLKDVEAVADKPLTKVETNFAEKVELKTVGAYVVDVTGFDRAGNSDTKSVIVLVKDEHTIIDEANNTMMSAYDFALNLTEVPSADFVAVANAEAWNIADGTALEVTLVTERPTTGGVHDATFTAGGTKATVKANITDDIDPELSADARIVYEAGSSKDEAGFLADIHATLNEAGTITSNFADIVNMSKVGAYEVTLNATDIVGNKSNTVKTIVLVKDANTVIDETNNTMMTAYDFSLNLTEVPSADFVAVAQAEAWNIADGTALEVTLVTEKPTTGGAHDTTFTAGVTQITVTANITDDIDPELSADARIVYDAGASKDEAEFLADIHATLNETGTMTSNFADVVNMSKVGVYEVTIQGEDIAGNKANTVQTIVLVKDANTVIDEANNTMITAYDFNLNLTEVPSADFVAVAQAAAWNITDGTAIDVTLVTEKPTTGGMHDTTFAAGTTKTTVIANITDDIGPELSADARVVYDARSAKAEAEFLADIHATLNEAGTITSNFADVVNMEKVGVYEVTIQGEDTEGNNSNTVQTMVLVKDANTVIDEANNTMITAYDFNLNLTEVPSSDFVAVAQAAAWNITDGTAIDVRLVTEKPTTGGMHDTTFAAGATQTTVKANIIDDIDPELSADARIVYEAGSSKDETSFLADIHATLNEAGTITSNFTDVVDMSKVGAYEVTLNATDTAGNNSNTVQTIVLVKDEHTVIDETNNTMITAYDFALNLSEVPSADFVALAQAEAWSIADGTVLELTLVTEKPTTGGVHDTTFAAGGTQTTVTANITDDIDPELSADARIVYEVGSSKEEAGFLADIHATLNEAGTITSNFADVVDMNQVGAYAVTLNATDTAGNNSNTVQTIVLVKDEQTVIDEANNTMMSAYDFALNLTEVPSADFVAVAKAEAWDIADGSVLEITLVTEKPTTGGVHDATFTAGGTQTTVTANITDDVDPELSADARVVYDAGSSKEEAEFLTDIHATLNEAGTITSNFADVVDMSKVGLYVVALEGTDVAGNKSNPVQTIVLVKDEQTVIDEANNTMISAYDFALNLSEVPSADFVAVANAEAWNIVDGTVLELTLVTEKPTTGGVHETTFAADATKITVKANITDDIDPVLNADDRIVYEAGVTKTEAEFLQDVHATLDESGTITSDFTSSVELTKVGVYVVTIQGKDTAGNTSNTVETFVLVKDVNTVIDETTNTMLRASDFALNLSEVPSADFIAAAKAQAWNINTGATIEVNLDTERPTTGGIHPTTFIAGATNKTVKALITDDIDPTLTVKESVTYKKGTVQTEADFFKDVMATLDEEGTITSDFTTIVDLNQVGVYTVTLQGADMAGNTTDEVFTQVLVTDENTIIDEANATMLHASDITLKLSELDGADFIALAGARAWDVKTGAMLTVTYVGDKPEDAGMYDAEFNADGTTKTVKLTITDDVPLALTADSRIVYETYANVDESTFMADINASLNKKGSMWSNFESTVDLTKVGVYVVTLQGTDSNGKPSNSVQVIVLVTDQDTMIDDENDTMLQASDFALRLSEVEQADFIVAAQARAWTISTGLSIPVTYEGVKPTAIGSYPATFSAGKSAKTVEAFIMMNTINLEADDIRLTVADFNRLKANGELASETLKRSQAKAYILETGQELTPLIADVSALLNAEVIGGESYDVVISYEIPTVAPTITIGDRLNNAVTKVSKIITVSIDKPTLIPGLPVTGENITLLMTGLVTFTASLTGLWFLFYRRRKNEEETYN